jgi:hypothetical protein
MLRDGSRAVGEAREGKTKEMGFNILLSGSVSADLWGGATPSKIYLLYPAHTHESFEAAEADFQATLLTVTHPFAYMRVWAP